MKSTGVIRNIDKLGRIVIPKEIRKNLKIRNDDSLEIFIQDDNIILKKHILKNMLDSITSNIPEIIYSLFNKSFFITDLERIICSNNKELEDVYLNEKFIKNIEKRDTFIANDKVTLIVSDDIKIDCYYIIVPLIVNGDLLGSIAIYSDNSNINDIDKSIIKFIIKFLEKNLED